jgi:hypothetical protein
MKLSQTWGNSAPGYFTWRGPLPRPGLRARAGAASYTPSTNRTMPGVPGASQPLDMQGAELGDSTPNSGAGTRSLRQCSLGSSGRGR